MYTVGIDLSTNPSRTASATIEWVRGSAAISELIVGVDDQQILERSELGTVGLDSPLGWPDDFVKFVQDQQTATITSRPEIEQPMWRRSLAYRATDEVVREVLGLVPLSVSTDRLGLVAMRASALLANIYGANKSIDRSGKPPVIEVYPAASLRAWQLPSKGYKTSADVRRQVLLEIRAHCPWLDFMGSLDTAIAVDHAFDALLAALSVRSWFIGDYIKPSAQEQDRAGREGWIVIPTSSLGRLAAD